MDATRCPDPDALLVLLYDDEGEPAERAALEAHVASCLECSHLLTSLDSTRGMLGAWHAPRLPLGFAIVRETPPSPATAWLWRSGLAAAAVLVLAAAASLARIDIQYDGQGLRVRTGVVDSVAPAATEPPALPASAAVPAAAPEIAQPTWVDAAAAANPAWRADLDLMESRLRAEFARALETRPAVPSPLMVRASVAPAPSADAERRQIEEMLRRVQELLDQSEVRQQQNLALRVNELGRQFQIQRQSDIDQMEQTLTRIEQQRSELLRRVASTQPRP